MKRALGYVRVSTQEQAAEGVSLCNQRERIEAYCTYKGYRLAGIVEDAGVSGGLNKARQGFVQLLDSLEQGDIEVVVLFSIERLSRDMLTLLALERLLDEYDIELHTIEGQIDTSTPDGFMGFAMKAFLGEMERRQVKYRTRQAMQYKKRQGHVIGSVPYGYMRQGDSLVVNEAEQQVIAHVNALYGIGYRLAAICSTLKAEGIKTRAGNDFTPMQVKRIIEGYEERWKKTSGSISTSIRSFVCAIA